MRILKKIGGYKSEEDFAIVSERIWITRKPAA